MRDRCRSCSFSTFGCGRGACGSAPSIRVAHSLSFPLLWAPVCVSRSAHLSESLSLSLPPSLPPSLSLSLALRTVIPLSHPLPLSVSTPPPTPPLDLSLARSLDRSIDTLPSRCVSVLSFIISRYLHIINLFAASLSFPSSHHATFTLYTYSLRLCPFVIMLPAGAPAALPLSRVSSLFSLPALSLSPPFPPPSLSHAGAWRGSGCRRRGS